MSDPNRYFARSGLEVTREQYQALRMRGLAYARVAFNTLDRTRHHPRGRAYIEVSTVWDGMDCFHEYGEPHSRLFETLVRTWTPPNGTTPDDDRYWWATEQEAIEGHEQVVRELMASGDDGAVTSGGAE